MKGREWRSRMTKLFLLPLFLLLLRIKEDEETIRGIKQEEEELSKSLESLRNEKRALSSRKEER